jgi:putative oxidoreductase
MSSMDDAGKLVLRLTVGILVLMHGIAKLLNGIGPIEGMLVARGMPAFVAWGAYIGEVLAPLLLIIGIYTRAAAAIVMVNMIVAIALAHSAEFFQLGKTGGWSLELQGMFLFGALAIVLLGAGRYSVAGKTGVMN